MELVWILAMIVALLVLIFYLPKREGMTNKDLMTTLSKFQEESDKHSASSSKSKKDQPYEIPIYGPKAEKVVEPAPTKGKGKGSGGDDTNVYPDIYGPEVIAPPGTKKTKPMNASDDVDESDDAYQFNPDLKKAFPTAEGDPQPFLTDFSKFQH